MSEREIPMRNQKIFQLLPYEAREQDTPANHSHGEKNQK